MLSIKRLIMFSALAIHVMVLPMGWIGEKTPFMYAAEKGDTKQMQALIDAGADVNAIEGCDWPRAGYPVLRHAIDSGSIDAVKLLLECGADPNQHTTSPIIMRDPSRSGANVRNLPLLSHAVRSHVSDGIVKLLIAHGADVNQKTICNEWTPLMVAAYVGDLAAMQLLITVGADQHAVNSCDGNRTASAYAGESGLRWFASLETFVKP